MSGASASAYPEATIEAALALGRAHERLDVFKNFLVPDSRYPQHRTPLAPRGTSAGDLSDPFSVASLRAAGAEAGYGKLTHAIIQELCECVADHETQVVCDVPLMQALARGDNAAAEARLPKAEVSTLLGDKSHFEALPASLVVFPSSTTEVSRLLTVCNAHRVPVSPAGTRTGLEGSSLPVVPGVILNMSRMTRVLRLCRDEMLVEVQPGIMKFALNDVLNKEGLFFPVDPGSNACVGGYANTGASGTLSYKYGTMRENCRQMTVVLGDGRVMVTRTRASKSSVGYNLHQLLIGSEGTLAVVTELVLCIRPLPVASMAARAGFPSTRHVTDYVTALISEGITQLARAELMNTIMMQGINKYKKTTYPEEPTLFLEFHGSTPEEVAAASARASSLAVSHGSGSYSFTIDKKEMDRMWDARRDALYAAFSLFEPAMEHANKIRKEKGLPPLQGADHASGRRVMIFTTDVCVPLPAMTESITGTEADFAALGHPLGVCCPIVGHVADGNYHCLIPYIASDEVQSNCVTSLNDRMVRRALELHGTASGEHGVGLGKMRFVEEERGAVAVDLMRKIKRALDPNGIMNPFKVFTPLPCEGH